MELIHMLILKNCPQDEQLLRFIKFCESKFAFKYPVTLVFLNKVRWVAGGIYRSNKHLIEIDTRAPYTKFHAFITIAHEIRHAYQHMYDTPEWNSKPKVYERDANTWAHAIVEEFGEVKKEARQQNLWITQGSGKSPSV